VLSSMVSRVPDPYVRFQLLPAGVEQSYSGIQISKDHSLISYTFGTF